MDEFEIKKDGAKLKKKICNIDKVRFVNKMRNILTCNPNIKRR